MRFLHTQRRIAHFVNGFTLAGALCRVGKQSHARFDTEDFSSVCSFYSGFHDFVFGRVDVDRAVSHCELFVAAHHNEAGAYGADARFAFDQLQRRTNGVCGGVGCAAQQAVSLPHFYQHRTEVVTLGKGFATLLVCHFALTQFYHFCSHFVHTVIVLRIEKLCTGDIETAVSSRFFDCLCFAEQDYLQCFSSQQLACCGKDTRVGTFCEYDRFWISLQFFFKFFKNCHLLITSMYFCTGNPRINGCVDEPFARIMITPPQRGEKAFQWFLPCGNAVRTINRTIRPDAERLC